MKHIIIVLTIFSLSACTNNHRKTRTEKIDDNNKTVKIKDDGQTMRIEVKIKNTEVPVDYDKSFDVRNMNEKQIEKLKDKILDSLYKMQ